MSDATYHTTRQDLRKEETRTAQQHGGKIPADSDVSQMKTSPRKLIRPRPTCLCPRTPPVASDWNSSDQRTVNVGSGRFEGPTSLATDGGDDALRGPATASSSVRVSGEQLHKNTKPE
ncbi:uncharacterized protein N7469_008380 [Penicillium citrinum]|uniref:Uncharacterized protein n=1 Tax=Penicillium citrinum TaxID=5077 RepID=A0A9W9NRL7_PENCI|nr:uncharacterized protein N7469_008380 [Penicillium citrinum]KAJ5224877.1 hypothetical protein N7469_008380 [Penicillium citrinum]